MGGAEGGGVMARIRPKCSCGARFSSVDVGDAATVVVKRTCPRCNGRWTLTVRPSVTRDGVHLARVDGVCLEGSGRLSAEVTL